MADSLKTFTIGYVCALIAIFLIAMALNYFFDYETGGGLGIVASLTGALWAGQKFAMNRKDMPQSSYSWQFALLSVIPMLVINGIVASLFASVFGLDTIPAPFEDIPLSYWLLGILVVGVIHILSARFFFSFGAKNQLKAEERTNS